MARDVWQKTITNLQGDVLEGAQITVRDQQTDALATIFANQSGGSALANPFLTDAQGVARFFAEPGFYKVTAFKDGFGTAEFVWNNVGDNRLREDISADGLNAATNLILRTGGTEQARITSAGNVGIGTSSPTAIGGFKTLTLDAVTGTFTDYRENTTLRLRIGADGGSAFINGSSGILRLLTNDDERMRIDSAGNVLAGVDNTQTLGGASNRWSVVFAGTGTINTSDAREKTPVTELTADELNAAKQLSKEIGTYKFLSAVAEKGDDARNHVGMTVQRAIEIMEANNLDPFAYGFICYDEWEEKIVKHEAVEAKEAVIDEEGNIIEEAVEAKDAYTEVAQEAGDRYSFRPDEMLFFIARGLEARIEALEG